MTAQKQRNESSQNVHTHLKLVNKNKNKILNNRTHKPKTKKMQC